MSVLDAEYTGPTIIDDEEYTGPTIVDDDTAYYS